MTPFEVSHESGQDADDAASPAQCAVGESAHRAPGAAPVDQGDIAQREGFAKPEGGFAVPGMRAPARCAVHADRAAGCGLWPDACAGGDHTEAPFTLTGGRTSSAMIGRSPSEAQLPVGGLWRQPLARLYFAASGGDSGGSAAEPHDRA